MQEEKLTLVRRVIEALPYGVMLLDREGRILALNRNCAFMLNVTPADVIEKVYDDVLDEAVGAVFSQCVREINERGFLFDRSVNVILPGGVRILLGLTGVVLRDEKGDQEGITVVCREMTARQELERMRELDKLKSDFVATVSHDLKAPLTSICGYAEVLMMFSQEKFNEEEKEYLQIIRDEGQRLTRMINDMLNVAAIESGALRLKPQPAALADILHDVIKVAVVNRNEYSFNVDLARDVPPLWLDREQIIRVLLNLVNNAVKYSPGGGDIDIRVYRSGDNFHIDVIDHGVGMSAETISHLFEKFFRADSDKISNIKGTGLGLVIAKGIVEAHGGAMAATSEEGKGSVFSVILPGRLQHHKPGK